MAWIALAFRYIARDSTGLLSPGDTLVAADRRWGDWTMTTVRDRASELLHTEKDPLDQLTGEIFSGHRNNTVRSIATAAIREAREESEAPGR